jgi:hypothetical protein
MRCNSSPLGFGGGSSVGSWMISRFATVEATGDNDCMNQQIANALIDAELPAFRAGSGKAVRRAGIGSRYVGSTKERHTLLILLE